uniref:Uncharacterized protein n=1 Tax=Percolomonas cosmopolitus TaxID=63605 RepID=A0A7S1PF46_9EUKA|mmetsp:Transcript_2818/g.10762  ORF Transcript_2818/g.10762 Transcript_2818/m.10762 type:complete len:1126 (+) Transcript_2818:2542-5919(+)
MRFLIVFLIVFILSCLLGRQRATEAYSIFDRLVTDGSHVWPPHEDIQIFSHFSSPQTLNPITDNLLINLRMTYPMLRGGISFVAFQSQNGVLSDLKDLPSDTSDGFSFACECKTKSSTIWEDTSDVVDADNLGSLQDVNAIDENKMDENCWLSPGTHQNWVVTNLDQFTQSAVWKGTLSTLKSLQSGGSIVEQQFSLDGINLRSGSVSIYFHLYQDDQDTGSSGLTDFVEQINENRVYFVLRTDEVLNGTFVGAIGTNSRDTNPLIFEDTLPSMSVQKQESKDLIHVNIPGFWTNSSIQVSAFSESSTKVSWISAFGFNSTDVVFENSLSMMLVDLPANTLGNATHLQVRITNATTDVTFLFVAQETSPSSGNSTNDFTHPDNSTVVTPGTNCTSNCTYPSNTTAPGEGDVCSNCTDQRNITIIPVPGDTPTNNSLPSSSPTGPTSSSVAVVVASVVVGGVVVGGIAGAMVVGGAAVIGGSAVVAGGVAASGAGGGASTALYAGGAAAMGGGILSGLPGILHMFRNRTINKSQLNLDFSHVHPDITSKKKEDLQPKRLDDVLASIRYSKYAPYAHCKHCYTNQKKDNCVRCGLPLLKYLKFQKGDHFCVVCAMMNKYDQNVHGRCTVHLSKKGKKNGAVYVIYRTFFSLSNASKPKRESDKSKWLEVVTEDEVLKLNTLLRLEYFYTLRHVIVSSQNGHLSMPLLQKASSVCQERLTQLSSGEFDVQFSANVHGLSVDLEHVSKENLNKFLSSVRSMYSNLLEVCQLQMIYLATHGGAGTPGNHFSSKSVVNTKKRARDITESSEVKDHVKMQPINKKRRINSEQPNLVVVQACPTPKKEPAVDTSRQGSVYMPPPLISHPPANLYHGLQGADPFSAPPRYNYTPNYYSTLPPVRIQDDIPSVPFSSPEQPDYQEILQLQAFLFRQPQQQTSSNSDSPSPPLSSNPQSSPHFHGGNSHSIAKTNHQNTPAPTNIRVSPSKHAAQQQTTPAQIQPVSYSPPFQDVASHWGYTPASVNGNNATPMDPSNAESNNHLAPKRPDDFQLISTRPMSYNFFSFSDQDWKVDKKSPRGDGSTSWRHSSEGGSRLFLRTKSTLSVSSKSSLDLPTELSADVLSIHSNLSSYFS